MHRSIYENIIAVGESFFSLCEETSWDDQLMYMLEISANYFWYVVETGQVHNQPQAEISGRLMEFALRRYPECPRRAEKILLSRAG